MAEAFLYRSLILAISSPSLYMPIFIELAVSLACVVASPFGFVISIASNNLYRSLAFRT